MGEEQLFTFSPMGFKEDYTVFIFTERSAFNPKNFQIIKIDVLDSLGGTGTKPTTSQMRDILAQMRDPDMADRFTSVGNQNLTLKHKEIDMAVQMLAQQAIPIKPGDKKPQTAKL